MSMKVVKLCLHCDTAQAISLIEFIDQLRVVVLEQYADEMLHMMRLELEGQPD